MLNDSFEAETLADTALSRLSFVESSMIYVLLYNVMLGVRSYY